MKDPIRHRKSQLKKIQRTVSNSEVNQSPILMGKMAYSDIKAQFSRHRAIKQR